MLPRLLTLGLAAALLCGCSLGPLFQTPNAPDTAWRSAPGPVAWPSQEWWRGFRSPELDGLIAAAEAGNQDIAAAAARVRQADAALRIAGAPLLPTVGADAKETWQRSQVQRRSATGAVLSSRYTETRTYSVQPTVSYELDLWGRIAATRDAALASALASRYDRQTVALTVVTSVASAWFQALALQDRLDVSARDLRDAQQILNAITARMQAGTASQLDVSQQAALVAGLRAQVPALQNQLQQQLIGLGILTGRPPSAITVRPGTLGSLALPEVSPGLPSEVLARRPDVAFAEASLRAAHADIAAARANYFPAVALSGAAGWQSLALSTLFGPGSLFATVTASVTQAIFNNGQTSAQVEQARGRYDELLADYRKSVLQAFTDVEDAVTAYRLATQQEQLEREAVARAQTAADIARAQLLAGTTDIVTTLQAQTTLFNDLDALAQVRLSRFQALLSLYKALGGGWSRDEVTAPATPLVQGVL